MPVPSVYSSLEPLLPLVSKPIQYVGGELNSVAKDWDAADVRWALMYPDAYEVGAAQPGHPDSVRDPERRDAACWPSEPTASGRTSKS